jgi:hypothetical protein
MAKMKTDLERSVALLHDVIEDSDITAEQLLAEGIPAEVVEAVLIQPDGRIVVTGKIFSGADHDFALLRYRAGDSVTVLRSPGNTQ